MRIAILGTDDDVLELVESAAARKWSVVWLFDLRQQDAARFRDLIPTVAEEAEWESVLDHAVADAVIVGTGSVTEEVRLDWLKRLVTDGIPTLTTYPISTSVLPYFELDMVRQEVGGLLLHYNRLNDSAVVSALDLWLRDGHPAIGRIRQVSWERHVQKIDHPTIFRALALETEVILRIVERVSKVSAFGPQQDEGDWASLNVQMSTAAESTVSWSVVPANDESLARIVLVGERGKLELMILDEVSGKSRWSVVSPVAEAHETAWQGSSPANETLDKLAAEVARTDSPTDRHDWETATRSMEIVDSVQLSLQRGRTIEILHQRLTEQLAFRGMMSAFGCGLLLLGMLVLVVAGVVGDTLGLRVANIWPIFLAGLLLVFLTLQFVPYTRRR